VDNGCLKEVEQGVFLRIPNSSQRELHPYLSRLARQLQAGQRKQITFKKLRDSCQLFELGNNTLCNKTFQQTTQTWEASNKTGEELNPTDCN
jgi:hypothetical protein